MTVSVKSGQDRLVVDERLWLQSAPEITMDEYLDVYTANKDYLDPALAFPNGLGRIYAQSLLLGLQEFTKQGWARGYGIREDADLIGMVNLALSGDGTAQLGYWITKGVQGRGVATKVGRTICRMGFEELSLGSVDLRIHPDNIPSQNVARRLGAVPYGHLAGYDLWSVHRG